MSDDKIKIRLLTDEEKPAALELIWEVFCEFEAPEYSEEGINTFREILADSKYISERNFYGAFDGEKLVGVLGIGKAPHINFFFVKSEYHRQGIGRKLFEAMLADCNADKITVNASPYAVEVYKRFGFVPTDSEQETSGIRYTPMSMVRAAF